MRQWGFRLTNISPGGEIVGNWLGKHHTEETKQKLRDVMVKTPVVVKRNNIILLMVEHFGIKTNHLTMLNIIKIYKRILNLLICTI